MDENMKQMIDEYKKQIDFDNISKSIDTKKTIVFQNINSYEWDLYPKKVQEKYGIFEEEMLKEWMFEMDKGNLQVQIFESFKGHEIAMNRLLNLAVSTTMNKSPYGKCPYNLGDINVFYTTEKLSRIMWTYYNVFFYVSYSGKDLDLEKLCRKLQEFCRNSVVDDSEGYKPKFKEIKISSKIIKIGEITSIQFVPEYGDKFQKNGKKDKGNFTVKEIRNSDNLKLIRESDMFLEYQGINSGIEKLKLILADMDSFTASIYNIEIEVTR
jgi:hypothetical protein